ncbi:MAG TPA: ATP-binding protein [Myxococcota bacterium]|nr:ATP-binding protein [Myxococcota bacterium]
MTTTPSPPASFFDLPACTLLETLSQLEQAVLVVDRSGRVVWMSDSLGLFCDSPSLAAGHSTRCSIEIRRGRGTGHVELSAVLLPGAQPEPFFLVTARPAVAREEAPRRLESAPEVSLAAILDSSPEAVLTLDPAGVVTYANPAVARLLGCAPEDVVSQPLTHLLWGSEEVERAVAAFPATSDGQTEDVTISRADGVTLCVSVSASPLYRADGMRVGTLAFLRDVTEQRSKAAEVARKNADLESYVHSVSHDLRSPLVSLLGFSRLLRQDHADQLGDSGRHFLDRIEQAGRTMEALINDLLELSRIGETAARKTVVDPRRTLLQLRAEIKPRLEAQGVELEICERPPLVLCDRIRLYQVFSNLVGNALDHMGPHPKPRIEIDVREEPDVHHVTVQDNGRGIHPSHHERIFEIFQSLGPRADGRRGTGVGLAIVKKIAETHGGRVWVESAPGEGACFHLTLPRE